jgi:hypothetical protein
MRSIELPWNNDKRLSDDMTRIVMKKEFFPYSQDKFIPDKPNEITSRFYPLGGVVGPCVYPAKS